MKFEFETMEEKRIPKFKGGEGDFIARMYTDEAGKIIKGRLNPGSSIGMHVHDTGSEIIYILKGNGKCLYDDAVESLKEGDCHYCPREHRHSLINDGDQDLIFFAVVTEQ